MRLFRFYIQTPIPAMKCKHFYIISVFAVGIIYLILMYGRVLQNPNSVMAANSGDGLKNYYVFAYPLANNGSISNTQCYNYPYGESSLYTDSHPVVLFTASILSGIFPAIKTCPVGIINFLMVISLLFTFLILYLLISKFVANRWYCLLYAFSITLLQPQIDRMAGHFALSYSCAIPLTWYLALNFYEKNRKWFSLSLLIVNCIFWFFIHPYLGAMTFAFVILFDFYLILFKKEFRNKGNVLQALIKAIVPIFIYFLITNLTDHHTGRTTFPWGFFVLNAKPESIFLPTYGAYADVLNQFLKFNRKWEGTAYIGIVATICFVVFVYRGIANLFQRKKQERKTTKNTPAFFAPAMFAAIVLLLFSMNIPIGGAFSFLLDGLPFLKMFRVVGRFSWPFFYVISVFTAVWIFAWAQKFESKKIIYTALLFLAPAVTICEAIPYQKMIRNWFQTKNVFLEENAPPICRIISEKINPQTYQALIPIPYYHTKSDNSQKNANEETVFVSHLVAFYLDLPLTACESSHTSIWETQNQLQLFSPDFYEKRIEKDISSPKKFLVLFNTTDPELSDYEKDFLKKADSLFSFENFVVMEINPEKMFETKTTDYLRDFESKQASLVPYGNFLLSRKDSSVFSVDYNDSQSKLKFLGASIFEPSTPNKTQFAEIEPDRLKKDTEYEASFWVYVGGKNYGQDKLSWMLSIEQNDDITLLQREGRDTPVFYEDWALEKFRFRIENESMPVRFFIFKRANKTRETTMQLDELVVRPVDVDVYRILQKDKQGNVNRLYKNGDIIVAE